MENRSRLSMFRVYFVIVLKMRLNHLNVILYQFLNVMHTKTTLLSLLNKSLSNFNQLKINKKTRKR